ncbi:hypothetical protein K437DRAFT_276173 [Tilletiaria anomala UBC 951]|uniref:Uncharacterized protein n=1 Tax=Tilletiaria anomala (strain ATCC 24038 / CBS 436.72 / UBC 951) TaxID=1037660 RepID=A0A066VJH1_TILAU|nr:uncharacterized protein K437DRAFT_276173 [Tilletiaria anomala UBC 951]KDN38869.1 hypothetical protein K437DRAFT_276173 [Tilletiaria anomala UBC 951]
MALPIYVPIGYIVFLLVSLSTFSRIYRRRSAQRVVCDVGSQPWFPDGHPERDIYQSLVSAAAQNAVPDETNGTQGGSSSRGPQPPMIPDHVLKAALLNRAMADVRRIMRMRDDKQALQQLLQKGSLGDETMERFQLAEKELEAEILDVVSEANTFKEGWGQIIFPSASEMVAHLKHKEIYYGIKDQRETEIRKLQKEGKPVPKPTVELPPLVTPPGTTIQVQAPQQANGAPSPLPPGAVLSGAQPLPPAGAADAGTPTGTGQQQIKMQLPPQIAAAIQANGGQITPQMLPAIAQANGGQLPPPLLAMVQQAQMQAQALAAQQQQAEGSLLPPSPGSKAAKVEDAGEDD